MLNKVRVFPAINEATDETTKPTVTNPKLPEKNNPESSKAGPSKAVIKALSQNLLTRITLLVTLFGCFSNHQLL